MTLMVFINGINDKNKVYLQMGSIERINVNSFSGVEEFYEKVCVFHR